MDAMAALCEVASNEDSKPVPREVITLSDDEEDAVTVLNALKVVPAAVPPLDHSLPPKKRPAPLVSVPDGFVPIQVVHPDGSKEVVFSLKPAMEAAKKARIEPSPFPPQPASNVAIGVPAARQVVMGVAKLPDAPLQQPAKPLLPPVQLPVEFVEEPRVVPQPRPLQLKTLIHAQQPLRAAPSHSNRLLCSDVPAHVPKTYSHQVKALITRTPAPRIFPTPGGENDQADFLQWLPDPNKTPAPIERIYPEQDAAMVYPLVVITPAKNWGNAPKKTLLEHFEEQDNPTVWKVVKDANIEEGWRQPCVLKGTCKANRAQRDKVDAALARIAPSSPDMAAKIDQRAALRLQSLALATLNEHLLKQLLPCLPEESRSGYSRIARAFTVFAHTTVTAAAASAGRSGLSSIQNRIANLRDKATALFSYIPVSQA
eukprot:jgi/Mesvir1/26905/Mv25915-RA.1